MESTLAVQSIPLTVIKPNDHNPRHVITPEAVDALTASFHSVGQETPIKVRPLTPEERAANPGLEYGLIGGHIRLEAAKKMGWGTLYGIVLPLSPTQAELASILDNQGEDMHWLDWYQAIESRLNAPSKPTQQRVADELGVNQGTVSRAKIITSLLTPASKQAIYAVRINQEGDYEVPEGAVRALVPLGDPSQVEKALQVVIERQMTEAEAQKLVKWVNSGHEAASFGQKPGIAAAQNAPIGAGPRNDSGLDSNDPYADRWEGLPPEVKVTMTPKGYRVVMDLAPSEALPVVYGALSNLEHLKGLCGEAENLTYRVSLPQVHQDAVSLRKREMAEKQAAISVKRPKSEKGKGVTAKAGEPLDSAQAEPGKKGFFGKLGEVIQQKTGLTPESLKDGVEGMLAKDAKQAANYEIRKGMRNILKDLF